MWITLLVFALANSYQVSFPQLSTIRIVWKVKNQGPTALDILASDGSAEIRLLVAGHPRASEPVLQRLLNESDDRAERLAKERLRSGRTP